MKENNQKLGLAFYHLKNKCALGSINGNEMIDFKFDEKQINEIFKFLNSGVFQGMFDVVSIEDYRKILELNYSSLERDEISNDKIEELRQIYSQKAGELEEFYKKYANEYLSSQPE